MNYIRTFASVALKPNSFKQDLGSKALLTLKNGQSFMGSSFGSSLSSPISGEVVFTTSLVGYPESMTDPSYHGQILVFSQPLIGNYGVPAGARDAFGLLKHFESEGIQVKGIIVNDYATKYSHWNAVESLGEWCARHGVPGITGVDTRHLITTLRDGGTTLGQISIGETHEAPSFDDPNLHNLVARVSTKTKKIYNPQGKIKIALIDCGAKQNIIRCLIDQGAAVTVVPWDYPLDSELSLYDGVFVSNGPGDPTKADKTIATLKRILASPFVDGVPIPIFGICMGHQLLGLAAGFKSYKLPFGNRGHNQPAINLLNGSCMITSQNHGFALDDKVPPTGWMPFFRNANDDSNEGIRHKTLPYSSVQFHPEAKGGPLDTEFLFKDFVEQVASYKAMRNDKQSLVVSYPNLFASSKAETLSL